MTAEEKAQQQANIQRVRDLASRRLAEIEKKRAAAAEQRPAD
jgi:hypothetical protein